MEELKYIVDTLEIFWYGDPNIPVRASFVQAIGMGITALSGIIGMISAKGKAQKAQNRREGFEKQLRTAESNRQDITNPYANITNLDSMINNPYANLQVATQAAEMQAEESDLSLASSLDTLRSTGASAGGATALAQAALRSKQGVSASIEKQEASNASLRAQGEASMNQQRMAEAQRMQQAQAAGDQFMFGAKETREVAQLNRMQAQASNAQQQEATQNAAGNQMMFSALGSIGGSLMGMGGNSSANSSSGSGTGINLTPSNPGSLGAASNFNFNSNTFGGLNIPSYGG